MNLLEKTKKKQGIHQPKEINADDLLEIGLNPNSSFGKQLTQEITFQATYQHEHNHQNDIKQQMKEMTKRKKRQHLHQEKEKEIIDKPEKSDKKDKYDKKEKIEKRKISLMKSKQTIDPSIFSNWQKGKIESELKVRMKKVVFDSTINNCDIETSEFDILYT